ncbi:AraC family transcriptional regulator [Paenibacillus sp. LjRoot56]|uniref:helix-turn-helix transcriptional regulator n=1 Tax=Paenibacillus sp. LjRoot56 TaxID=3342333 RepID=UPI003ECE59B2
MTFPINKQLSDYPNIGAFPFHLSINRVDQHFPSHRHDFLEFSLVVEGYGYETVNGQIHPMQPGTFTLLLPYQVHEITANPGSPLILFNCMFGLELLGDPAERLLLSDHNPFRTHYDLSAEQSELIRQKLQGMLREYEQSADIWQSLLLKGELQRILAFLYRLHPSSSDVLPNVSELTSKTALPWAILRYIHTRYRDPLTLELIGAHFHCHPSRVTQILSQHLGVTFVTLLQETRIRHACSLLATTEMKVTDIAFEVGYESFASFSRNFLKLVEISPTMYRASMRVQLK